MIKEENFLDTIVNYAVVVRTTVGTVRKLKEDILRHNDVDVIYQRYSFNKLIVHEENCDSC
ncbi:MAG: hypothetical protein PHZ19_05335 [Candidatus Thermoplasmatota archaeon]|nr:hypothetical protein [Candidatus Thermoplasmatota archaeon]